MSDSSNPLDVYRSAFTTTNGQQNLKHDIICLVLKEMIRARYDHSHHTPEIIAKNVATARAYAEKVYPEAK